MFKASCRNVKTCLSMKVPQSNANIFLVFSLSESLAWRAILNSCTGQCWPDIPSVGWLSNAKVYSSLMFIPETGRPRDRGSQLLPQEKNLDIV